MSIEECEVSSGCSFFEARMEEVVSYLTIENANRNMELIICFLSKKSIYQKRK